MNAIPAIPAIDEALRIAKPIGSIEKSAAPSPELAQKFEALMKRAESSHGIEQPSGKSAFNTMLESAQSKISASDAHMKAVLTELPGMSSSEATAATMLVAQEVAAANEQVTIATSLVSASKGSLDSLLKNS